LQVVLADELAVEVHTIRIVDRRTLEEVEPTGLRRRDDVAQLAIRKSVIADEIDAFDFRRVALGDLEHEIHAVLFELDDLRLDVGGKTALAAVDVENALHIGLGLGARKDRSRLELHFSDQRSGVDLAVALEGDLSDDRIFLEDHDDRRTLGLDRNIGKQTGREQSLDRTIDLRGAIRITHVELQVRAHGFGLDAPIAADFDILDHA